jgi:hypothetical protein
MYDIPFNLDQYAKDYQRERIRQAEAFQLAESVKARNGGFQILSTMGSALINLGDQLRVRRNPRTTVSA